jgi:YesN/AraC family two-component response regulator
MIKVMVVDDEEIVHLGLQALTDWESHGFSLCYDAANGLAALEMLEKNHDIQIVLVDLQMPKMDGMQFLEEINRMGLKEERDLEVIVLSAYDRYDLIRQAFRLGVSDYVVKFEMNKDEILKQLENAAKRLAKPNFEQETGEKAHSGEGLLANVLMGGDLKELLDTKHYAFFSVAYVLPDNPDEFADKLPLMRGIARDLASQELYVDIASLSAGEAGMLFAFKSKSLKTSESELEAALRKFHSYLKNYMNLQVTIGAGNVFSDAAHIGRQYAVARQNADMCFVLGRRKIIFPRDLEGIVSRDMGSMAGLLRKLISALRSGDETALSAELEAVLKAIEQYNPKKIDKIFPYYFEILFSVMLYLDEIGATAEDVFRRNVNFYEEIQRCKTRDELNIWMRNIVGWIADYLKDKSGGASRPVNMAKDFIMRNFFDKTLSLPMVSSYVGISENHLSSIFTKQTGQTFTESVTGQRIEKAKTLLKETNLKVYEIAEDVGFANAEYFSKIFMKTTGKSPNQFISRS